MKFYRKIVLFGLAAIGLAACSNDENKGINLDPTDGDSWASFAINLPKTNSFTRAGGDYGTEAGTIDEQKIKDVRVVLYDDAKSQVKYALDYTITGDGNSNIGGEVAASSSKSQFITKAKKIKKANYYVLVLVNPKQAVKNVTVPGRNLLDFNQAVKLTADDLIKNGFFMSNDQGLVLLKESRLKKTEAEAETSGTALPVKVDRAVAKVLVKAPEGGVVTAEGSEDKVSNFSWTLDVTNTKTFWIRNVASIAQADGSDATPEVIGDPDNISTVATPRFMRYAKDPNYDKKLSTEEAKKEFNYLPEELEDSSLKKFGEHLYTLENTMGKDQQLQNQTTRVMLKATYTPAGMTEGDDWFSYLGIRMNVETFTKAFIKAIKDEPIEGSNLPASFAADMKKVQTDGKVTLNDDNETINISDKSFVSNNLKFYKDGINYFPVTIRHFDDELVPTLGGYGRFGIVRNNVYKLNITQIKSPGEPIVPPIDPEEPDDKENVYVAFDVEVLPWVVREQDVVIE